MRSISLAQIGQLAWAAQGITDSARNRRTAPSAGALYPLEVYFVKKDGVFQYDPLRHQLRQLSRDDRRLPLAMAPGGQPSQSNAPVDVVITGVPERLRGKYHERAERYMYLEAGHVAQNLLLQAVSLGLGGVPQGSFDDHTVARVMGLPAGEVPIYLIPMGKPLGMWIPWDSPSARTGGGMTRGGR